LNPTSVRWAFSRRATPRFWPPSRTCGRACTAPNPAWPRIDFAELGGGALVALDEGCGADYVAAIFRAVWATAADLSLRPRLLDVLAQAKIDGDHLLQRTALPEYVARLKDSTAAAAERGVFGSPTMFVGNEMFFGNDRFDFMTQALAPAA
jgi:2-hydroxychromene-2-carboxylate isomerase